MINTNTRKSGIETGFVFLVCVIFAIMMLAVLLLGVKAYEITTTESQCTTDRALCTRYIEAKIRNNDSLNKIQVKNFDKNNEIPCLVINDKFDGVAYTTRIYYYDGYVRELFAEKGIELEPGDGQQVIKGAGLELEKDGNLISGKFTDENGVAADLNVNLRTGK